MEHEVSQVVCAQYAWQPVDTVWIHPSSPAPVEAPHGSDTRERPLACEQSPQAECREDKVHKQRESKHM